MNFVKKIINFNVKKKKIRLAAGTLIGNLLKRRAVSDGPLRGGLMAAENDDFFIYSQSCFRGKVVHSFVNWLMINYRNIKFYVRNLDRPYFVLYRYSLMFGLISRCCAWACACVHMYVCHSSELSLSCEWVHATRHASFMWVKEWPVLWSHVMHCVCESSMCEFCLRFRAAACASHDVINLLLGCGPFFVSCVFLTAILLASCRPWDTWRIFGWRVSISYP